MKQQKIIKRNEKESNLFPQSSNSTPNLNEISNDRITFSEDNTNKKSGCYKLIKGQFFKQFSFKDTSLKEYLHNEIKQMTRSSSAQTLDAKSHKSAALETNKLFFSSDKFKSKNNHFFADLSSPSKRLFDSFIIKKPKQKKKPRNLFLKSNNNMISKYKSNYTAFSQKGFISNTSQYNNNTSYPCTTVRSINKSNYNSNNFSSNYYSNCSSNKKSNNKKSYSSNKNEDKAVKFRILVDLKNFM